VPAGRARGARALAPAPLLALALGAGLAGCGGGTRQDAHEASRTYQMSVVRASFPTHQTIARPTQLEFVVRNTGSRTVPTVAITVDSLEYTERFPELAANKRPVWAIEQGPGPVASPPVQTQEVSQLGGAQNAYVKTWALGALAPGKTQTFRWRLVPVKAGVHSVDYLISAGLSGKARARLASGSPVSGHLHVTVAASPALNHVDPNTGRVVPGPRPLTP
jgi:hypothetical protein